MGHVWREFTPATMSENAPTMWRRALRCDVKAGGCGAQRFELINKTGEIHSRTYKYSEGYQLKGLGVRGGLSKSWFRQEYFNRFVDGDSSSS